MPATADVAFAGIQYIQRPLVHDSPSVHMCALHACLALQWAAQVQRLAGYVANEGGLSTRVHLWTPCVREADAATIFQGGPPVLVHNRHDPELEGALRQLRERQPRKGATNEKVHWKGKGLFGYLEDDTRDRRHLPREKGQPCSHASRVPWRHALDNRHRRSASPSRRASKRPHRYR